MANLYDSERIREAAHQAHKMSARIEGDVVGLQDRCLDDVELIKGETAKALAERIELLESQIRCLSYEIGEVGDQLNNYAVALEAIGADLVEVMRGR